MLGVYQSSYFLIINITLEIMKFHCLRLLARLSPTTVRDLGVTLDSASTFSQHISNLTRSCFFQLGRLRTIRKAVSVPILTSIVHAFVCSRIDYCNSLLIGLPKIRLYPIQNALNAAARLIARLPRYSHISFYIKEHLHCLPISTRIECKVLLIVLKAQMRVAPKYLRDAIRLPTSASSLRPLRQRFPNFLDCGPL